MKDARHLRHFGDRLVQRIPGDMPDILPIDQDATFLRLELTAEQADERRLAGARGTDQADSFPRPDVEVEILEDLEAIGVTETDILEKDMTTRDDERVGIKRIGDFVRRADEIERFGQGAELLEIIQHAERKLLHTAR